MCRDVRIVEITEVLRLWRAGVPKKRIAARVGLDPKTHRFIHEDVLASDE
jgi:hypothetical protein